MADTRTVEIELSLRPDAPKRTPRKISLTTDQRPLSMHVKVEWLASRIFRDNGEVRNEAWVDVTNRCVWVDELIGVAWLFTHDNNGKPFVDRERNRVHGGILEGEFRVSLKEGAPQEVVDEYNRMRGPIQWE